MIEFSDGWNSPNFLVKGKCNQISNTVLWSLKQYWSTVRLTLVKSNQEFSSLIW